MLWVAPTLQSRILGGEAEEKLEMLLWRIPLACQSLFRLNPITTLRPRFSPAIKEVNGRAAQNQRSAEGGVQYGRVSGGKGFAIAGHVVAQGEDKIDQAEGDEEHRHPWVKWHFEWPRGIRFFTPEHDHGPGIGSVEKPAHENQGVGQRVECSADQEHQAP